MQLANSQFAFATLELRKGPPRFIYLKSGRLHMRLHSERCRKIDVLGNF